MRSTLDKIAVSLEGPFAESLDALTEHMSVQAEDRVVIDPAIWEAVVLAHGIGQHIDDMSQEERNEVWQRWLKRHLTDRVSGIPTALSFEEANAIVRWVSKLGALFPEVVEIVEKISLQKEPGYSVTEDLEEKKLSERYPSEACKLCNHVLEADDFPSSGKLETLHSIFGEKIPNIPEFERFLEIRYNQG